MPSISGKTYLITGTSRGIGLELVRQLLEDGATVIATCRNPDSAKDLAKIKDTFHGSDRLSIFPLDVTKKASIAAAAADITKAFPGGIDVLINNAAIASTGPDASLLGGDYDVIMDMLATNTVAPIMVIQAFFPLLEARAASGEGLIVNISSTLGSIGLSTPDPTLNGYSVSKAALNAVTARLSEELQAKANPVSIVSVHPGWVDTDMGNWDFIETKPPVGVEDSVSGILSLLRRPAVDLNRKFIDYNGQEIAW
jgi:NAD(P)-dependent dehydrogenase (short-subunit alcohol dehydrogenase family)